MNQNAACVGQSRKGATGIKLTLNEFMFLILALVAVSIILYLAVRYGTSLSEVISDMVG